MNDETNPRTTDTTRATGTNDAPPPHADRQEQRLSRLADFEVDDGYADIRGWPVRGSNGRELGVVGDLLVDTAQMEVEAIEVHLGVGAAGVRGNVIGSARVPIESVQLRTDRYVVVDVDVIPCEDALTLPGGDEGGAPRRVPCGQIGIRRRDASRRDVEVPRPAEGVGDAPSPS